ncbi:hypothetical protein MKX03_011865, partial [Papaver bracteatum]
NLKLRESSSLSTAEGIEVTIVETSSKKKTPILKIHQQLWKELSLCMDMDEMEQNP